MNFPVRIVRAARFLGVIGIFAFSGCSSDGGVGGTGISSIVQGNIIQLGLSGPGTGGGGAVAGIEVVVMENTRLADTTDSEVYFVIEGVFPDVSTLEFRRLGHEPAKLTIFVPASSVVDMDDVGFNDDGVAEAGEITLDYEASLEGVLDCSGSGGLLAVADKSGAILEVTFGAEVLAAPLACDNLCVGDELGIIARQTKVGITGDNIKRTKSGPGCGPIS